MKMNLATMCALLGLFSLASNLEAKESLVVKVPIAVTEGGFEPKTIDLKPGSDVVLTVTRRTDVTCAKQLQVPSRNIKVDLPLNQTVPVTLGKVKKGEIRFGCGMNMMESGQIFVR